MLLSNNGILPLDSQTLNASRIAVLGLLGGCGAADPTRPPYAWCAAKQAQLDDYSTGWGGFGTTIIGVQKRLLFAQSYTQNADILPRQAPDKHRKS